MKIHTPPSSILHFQRRPKTISIGSSEAKNMVSPPLSPHLCQSRVVLHFMSQGKGRNGMYLLSTMLYTYKTKTTHLRDRVRLARLLMSPSPGN